MSKPRYGRHNLIPAWNQEKLTQAKVAVIGCGALGNEVLKNLALLGIGQIWVVDYDSIEIHKKKNLPVNQRTFSRQKKIVKEKN